MTKQSGNITASEPTNMIVGTMGDDADTYGTLRADIILGRAGNDLLDGGDRYSTNPKAWGDDQLFGGLGDDTFFAGYGSDLLHGGDRGSTASSSAQLQADGMDIADYSGFGAANGGRGIRIAVTAAAPIANFATARDASADIARAVYVTEIGGRGDTDTLISIEKIVALGGANTLAVTSFDSARLADANHVGGLSRVEFGPETGDLVDLSGLAGGALVSLGGPTSFISALDNDAARIEVAGIDKVIGSSSADTFTIMPGTLAPGIVSLEGGRGKDSFVIDNDTPLRVDGGADDDLIQIKKGGAQDINGGDGNDYIQLLSSASGVGSIRGGSGNDIIDLVTATVIGRNSASKIYFGPNDGHDVVRASADQDNNRSRDIWNVSDVQLEVTSPGDITVIWDYKITSTISNPSGNLYYANGDLVFKINSTGASMVFEDVYGSWAGSSASDYWSNSAFSLELPYIYIPGTNGSWMTATSGVTFAKGDISQFIPSPSEYSGPTPAPALPVEPEPPVLPWPFPPLGLLDFGTTANFIA